MMLLVEYFKEIYSEQMGQDETRRLLEAYAPHLPMISLTTHYILTYIPSAAEIFSTLILMGLDTAPGPDGITARLLKEKWAIFGHGVVGMIQEAFHTGWVPEPWMLSNLVLIPKTDHPSQPTYFLPTKCLLYLLQVADKDDRETGEVVSAGPYLPHTNSLFEGEEYLEKCATIG
jgi:hypothetical protein